MNVYDKIGIGYDTTRKADPQICQTLYEMLHVKDGDIVDIGCGTGNYTVALHGNGFRMTGIDISEQMLNEARRKSSRITWVKANVAEMPLSSHTFQGATCILAIHHFSNLLEAFQEIYRVLEKGKQFVIFTSSPLQMENYWLNSYFPNMMKESINKMPSIDIVYKTLMRAGFSSFEMKAFSIDESLQDFFLYSGKFNPQIYLSDHVQKGISSFANLSTKEEVKRGCSLLEKDLNAGLFLERTSQYDRNLGDYLFISAKK
jgi:ubiquinone/menaquinone biosynthesis C-methylase UbiE